MSKWVYSFGDGKAEGGTKMRNLLGGKGADLAEMSALGLPVPPGFTVTTEVCTYYFDHDNRYPDDLTAQMDRALTRMEKQVGAKFGERGDPSLEVGGHHFSGGLSDEGLDPGQ